MQNQIHKIILIFISVITLNLPSLIASPENDFRIVDLSISGESDYRQCTSHTPLFSWNYSESAKEYRVMIELYRRDGAETSLLLKKRFVASTIREFLLDQQNRLQGGKTYFFTIRSRHPELGWSETDTLEFTINTPPTAPEFSQKKGRIINSDTLNFSIKPAGDQQVLQESLGYKIEIKNLADNILRIDTLYYPKIEEKDSLAIVLQHDLEENSHFLARIRAFDGVEYSEAGSTDFFINRRNDPPKPFDIMAINDTLQSEVVPLEWQGALDPESQFGGSIEKYVLEIATDQKFKKIILEKSFDRKVRVYDFEKPANHRFYYWRVKAVDNLGEKRYSRQTGYFVINISNKPPEPAALMFPVQQEIMKPQDFIIWQQKEDPNRYDLLSFKILITDYSVSDTLARLQIDNSILESAQNGELSWLSYNYQNIIKAKLIKTIGQTNRLEEGNYYRVIIQTRDNWGGRAENDFSKAVFQFDDGINEVPAPPVIGIYPDSVVVNEPPVRLGWYPANDPDLNDELRYEVLISRSGTGNGSNFINLETEYGQNKLNLQHKFVENSKYSWKIRSIDIHNAKSDWTRDYCFYINFVNEAPDEIVQILEPENWSELNSKTVFKWELISDPDPGDSVDYLLELADDKYFRNIKFDKRLSKEELSINSNSGIASFSFGEVDETANLKENAIYFWRIAAVDQKGLRSPYRRNYPRLTYNTRNDPPLAVNKYYSTKNGKLVNTQTPTLKWGEAEDPDFMDFSRTLKYTIQLSRSRDFKTYNIFTYQTREGVTSYKIPKKLDENTRWYYQIQTIDMKGATSDWSQVDSFIVNARQEPPQVVDKGFVLHDNAITETREPKISWRPVQDPDFHQNADEIHYIIKYLPARYLGTRKERRKTRTVKTSPGRTTLILPKLRENRRYCYQVRAVDPDGKKSPWSGVKFFIVNSKQEAPRRFELVYPKNGSDSIKTDITFKWRKSRDPDPKSEIEYTIFVSTDSLFSQNVIRGEVVPHGEDTLIYRPPTALKTASKYFWKVIVEDNTGLRRKMPAGKGKASMFTTVGYKNLAAKGNKSALLQNSPNPFNRITNIKYYISDYSSVRIIIYNVLGEKVKVLVNGKKPQGHYRTSWDGTNQDGRPVPGGMYFCRMFTGENNDMIKMVLLR